MKSNRNLPISSCYCQTADNNKHLSTNVITIEGCTVHVALVEHMPHYIPRTSSAVGVHLYGAGSSPLDTSFLTTCISGVLASIDLVQ